MLSMTGFGKGGAEGEHWKANVIIRSLNGKGLDISVRMPSFLLSVEPKIKEAVKSKLRRGTVNVMIDVESKTVLPPVDINKLTQNVELVRDISRKLELSVKDDTVFEYAWKYSEKAITEVDEELENTVLQGVENALRELIASRKREGEALKEDLSQRVDRIESLLNQIVEKKDQIMERVKEKILEKAKRLELPEEHPTVMNELLFLLEKMDIEEEITRLKTHIKVFRTLLDEGVEVGKKLEFLGQEMHREITTLGNKIPDLSEYVVEIKTEIDRIKQQAANVE
ncbi:uncharacterized protein (TIGR00255 family) [Hydrogenivirga caldilitoris]|uniref:Uncharacterized protein (TIGR00255 family) n=1 Tax=Hydrogenivirga caldilitoris TaxID=246264 RepID=A0A497XN68_9AQUI|nr:YicC/YloC family endoribonuclease [Hydrogenivirga caldilitoris]RLJ70365.1 uncharacterized protein (TIGR00255 family) [Hydrogenivirga caldilitoris]